MEEKKKSDSEFLSYNLMLNSEKKILNETKNHNLPCKLNGRSLSHQVKRTEIYANYKHL